MELYTEIEGNTLPLDIHNGAQNNQTTSTKCQYRIPDSTPTWCVFVTWYEYILIAPTNKNKVPIITCTISINTNSFKIYLHILQYGLDYIFNK